MQNIFILYKKREAQDMENKNELVIFYQKYADQNTIQALDEDIPFDINRPQQLIRRVSNYFTASKTECDQLKTISYRIPQNQNTVSFDTCLTPDSKEPTRLEYPEDEIYQQKRNAYISTPFYNVFEKPQGKNLKQLCIDFPCRFLIRDIAQSVVKGLTYLQSSTECYKHGNLNLHDIFFSDQKSKFTISNFQYNKYVGTKSTVPWQTDLAELGLILIRILSRSESYLLNQYILTPLDLFNEINKSFKFPIVRGEFPKVPEQPSATYSKVISFFQFKQKNLSQKDNSKKQKIDTGENIQEEDPNQFKSSVDVDLGVPENFNPNDMRLSLMQKNEELAESVYDFIFQLMGNTFVKNTQIKQFLNLEEALQHPFLSKDLNSNPSDY